MRVALMGSGRGHSVKRREPVFDGSPEIRLAAGDRSAPATRPSATRRRRSGKRRKLRRNRRSLITRIAYWSLVLGLWLGIGGIGAVVYVGAHLPPLQALEIPKRAPSVRIVDYERRALATRGDRAGEIVPLRQLPGYVPKAFIAIEDQRFHDHFGVDPYGIARALVANVTHLRVTQGASTITQQLAKNLFLTRERTVYRKLQEMLLALWLERKFTKTRILELYLNRVYFGAGAYGIEQAAQRYFGKSARHITLAEAALLAGLVKAPSRLAPTRNFNGAEKRARIVLAQMRKLHFINRNSARNALAHPPRIVARVNNGPVNYVADWVMDAVNDVVGHVDEDIVVRTTIDAFLQADAEQAFDDALAKKGDKYKVSQGALVAMTPDGAVRALIGGRDYGDSQFNRAVAARRQPGSAFKLFVYLAALERGLTPETVRMDAPINIRGWKPENYGHDYHGPVSLTQALALSLNTVAVRLAMEVGPSAVVRTAHRLGIASRLEPNASIALGTSEVSLLELTGAYATFANGGHAVAPHVIGRITTAGGKLLYAHRDALPGRIVDARYAGMMNAMLEQTLAIGTAKHASLPGWPAAGKTGTSQDFRDAWFIGYTARLVTGVWLGNDDGAPTRHVTGGGMPVQIWSRFMRGAHQGVPVAALPGYAAGGGRFAGLFGGTTAAPRPPAPVQPAATGNARATGGGLDGWFINNLFGSRRN
jgi:penicillin-binding protein 1A